MSHDFWYEAGLIAAGVIFLVLLVLASFDGRKQEAVQTGRHAVEPVCPCGCGRHPGEHVEVLLSHVPPQPRRPL